MGAKGKNKIYSEEDLESLVFSNKILKQHLEFLRNKLRKTESLLNMFIEMAEEEQAKKVKEEQKRNKFDICLN